MVLSEEVKREIGQLWLFAEHYFSLATRLKRKLPKNYLNKTARDIANKYPNPSDASGNDKRLLLVTAHLSSCSVRLCTIEETLEEKLPGDSRIFPDYLKHCANYKTVQQLQKVLTRNKDKHTHQMLRDNVAHTERSFRTNKHKNLYEARQRTLELLRYQEIYDSVNKVVQRFKKELGAKNIL